MPRTIMLIPIGIGVNLISIGLGVFRIMKRKGIRFNFFKPIFQPHISECIQKQVITVVNGNSNSTFVEPLKINYVELLLSSNQKDVLMEKIVSNYYVNVRDEETVIVEGLVSNLKYQFCQLLNYEMAQALNAEIIFVISQNTDDEKQLQRQIELAYNSYYKIKDTQIIGIIISRLDTPVNSFGYIMSDLLGSYQTLNVSSEKEMNLVDSVNLKNSTSFPILGIVPRNHNLISIYAMDIAHYLDATIINAGDINARQVKSITFCTNSISHLAENLHTGTLLVTSTDRIEILVTACLAVMNGIKISAILLTGGYKIDVSIRKLCDRTFSTGLPIFSVNTDILRTILDLQNFNFEVVVHDEDRIEKIQEYVANYIDISCIQCSPFVHKRKNLFSPPAFRYQLTELARKAKKRIVLPEGDDPRTVKAASICAERGIATCVLLGDPKEIILVADSQNIKLSSDIEIIDPNKVRENYVSRLIELRKNKGMTEAIAREQLKDNVVLGTLKLEKNEVDGLVSGAVHTTAETIRPSLQLIKTSPGSSLVSSVFFMLLPDQVYVYGDCAINSNPNAEQLAEIAIQSADSASAFGIEPFIAMLSYSTGTSGVGSDVEKVREATRLVKLKRPDLIIDGPIQYDAAVMADVAKSKAPNSPIAGHATVFIFPDLNTGNITYKAVQRSANLTSIGPMLQGMRKPVNDLSRGALVDDIVYTIALTVIQANR